MTAHPDDLLDRISSKLSKELGPYYSPSRIRVLAEMVVEEVVRPELPCADVQERSPEARLNAIRQLSERHIATNTATPEAAGASLVRKGIYTPAGELAPEYRPALKETP